MMKSAFVVALLAGVVLVAASGIAIAVSTDWTVTSSVNVRVPYDGTLSQSLNNVRNVVRTVNTAGSASFTVTGDGFVLLQKADETITPVVYLGSASLDAARTDYAPYTPASPVRTAITIVSSSDLSVNTKNIIIEGRNPADASDFRQLGEWVKSSNSFSPSNSQLRSSDVITIGMNSPAGSSTTIGAQTLTVTFDDGWSLSASLPRIDIPAGKFVRLYLDGTVYYLHPNKFSSGSDTPYSLNAIKASSTLRSSQSAGGSTTLTQSVKRYGRYDRDGRLVISGTAASVTQNIDARPGDRFIVYSVGGTVSLTIPQLQYREEVRSSSSQGSLNAAFLNTITKAASETFLSEPVSAISNQFFRLLGVTSSLSGNTYTIRGSTQQKCVFEGASLQSPCGADGICQPGETVQAQFSFSGDCPTSSAFMYMEATGGSCDLDGSDMPAMTFSCTPSVSSDLPSGPDTYGCSASWTVPEISEQCSWALASVDRAILTSGSPYPSGTQPSEFSQILPSASYATLAGQFRLEDIIPPTATVVIFRKPDTAISVLDYKATNSFAVRLELNYTDIGSGVSKCELSFDGTSWTDIACNPGQRSVSRDVTLPSGSEGMRFALLRVTDNRGNVGLGYDYIIYDTTAPELDVYRNSVSGYPAELVARAAGYVQLNAHAVDPPIAGTSSISVASPVTSTTSDETYYIQSFLTHCDIGGPFGWRETQAYCPGGTTKISGTELNGKCPSPNSVYPWTLHPPGSSSECGTRRPCEDRTYPAGSVQYQQLGCYYNGAKNNYNGISPANYPNLNDPNYVNPAYSPAWDFYFDQDDETCFTMCKGTRSVVRNGIVYSPLDLFIQNRNSGLRKIDVYLENTKVQTCETNVDARRESGISLTDCVSSIPTAQLIDNHLYTYTAQVLDNAGNSAGYTGTFVVTSLGITPAPAVQPETLPAPSVPQAPQSQVVERNQTLRIINSQIINTVAIDSGGVNRPPADALNNAYGIDESYVALNSRVGAWWQARFSSNVTVRNYTLRQPPDGDASSVTSIALRGSRDNVTWVLLDNITSGLGSAKEFNRTIASPGAYEYYQFWQSTTGNLHRKGIDEVDFYTFG